MQIGPEFLTALFANGHVLLVGVPGLAKTLLIRSVARVLDLSFSRIQFTPDLMPSDITGTEILEESGGHRVFKFIRGPIFANVVLADEINRTPPKTQAALLEAMQEYAVTYGGTTYPLDKPFFVLATQNPIEQTGTYPLPEAQLDRFLLFIRVGYPHGADETEILRRTTGRASAEARPVLDVARVGDNMFFSGTPSQVGGRAGLGAATADEPRPEGQRINMVTAIRRVLDQELEANPKVLVFGEDVGPKGGVHAVTLGLQDKFGVARVFDTSLNEEGIVGRAAGMALAGLMPVPEIQFRKYAEPATEQINDIGTMRWRTANRFSAPMVLRVPGGFFKCGDPWHSQTNEVQFVHNPGWLVAVPSNAEDAVGLLRAALRGHDPVLFFEHRAMLDDAWARRPWPGDDYALPFGRAKRTREGDKITIVSWGAMVPRCEAAAEGFSADVIDLRTLMPWDREMVLDSVRRTRRCLIVHEDLRTGGFGAEIAAVVAEEAFLDLDAPVARVTMPDFPSPHHPKLMEAALPSVAGIRAEIDRLVGF